MIKFWKSAAKGKTGCPVRPPELVSGCNFNILSTKSTDDNDDIQNIFEKRSKLSLSIDDVLIEKKALKYFIQFMDSIRQDYLIKCWLDLENFKVMVGNIFSTNNDSKNNTELNRTYSLDLHFEINKHCQKLIADTKTTQKKDLHSEHVGLNKCSTSSCGNLAESVMSTNVETQKSSSINELTQEAVNLFRKYVAIEAPYQFDLPDSIRKVVISNICTPDQQLKEDCFKPIQDKVYIQISENYFNEFLQSSYYIKAQIDILTEDSLNLNDILYNETVLFYFTEYLEQESCRVLLEFVMAVMHFRDNVTNSSANSDQVQADAIVLYEKYFSLQASNPVGFPTDIRLKIENEICREGGLLNTCFDLPCQIVIKMLKQYVKTFLESELYYKYISEMIRSVDRNRKSHSDCSSEYSVSTQNTLLAMGDHVFRKKKRNHSVPDMTIDSNQLYNADSLWQRNRQDGLCLGRVTSLGRFESKLEPDPDKKESVLKKVVNRFVPTSTSKVEEEMAWQIAHMIVKDVTDLTMAPPEADPDDI